MWADIQQLIAQLWADSRVRAGLVMAGAIAAAYLIELVFRRSLAAMAAKTTTELDDKIVAALRRPIFWTVILVGLWWAISLLMVTGRFVVDGFIKSIAVILWTLAAMRVGEAIFESVATRGREDSIIQIRTLPIFDMLSKIVLISAAAYFAFLAWDINVSAWVASAGIVGIAVGFAARDSLANLFAGIFLLADNIYKVGDFIVLNNDPALRGRVRRIGMRSTRILTLDDVEITVPNSLIGNATVVNEAGGPSVRQRIRAQVSVAYGSDIDRVFRVLKTCADGIEGISDEPKPVVRFMVFGASGLDFEVLVWISNPADRDEIISRLNTCIYKDLGAADIEIPYSKHDVYIKEIPGTAAAGSDDGANDATRLD
ncbi:MAG: mechanosensitive ion channel family protein [Proteobacteria bacterium]|nr:mechanosensitive ion channel family protein [Pseudomonadota bacterium]